jgi:hypothetical protein
MVEQRQHIGHHVEEQVALARFPTPLEVLRAARIPVVEADDVAPCRRERVAEALGPLDPLGAMPHDEQHSGGLRVSTRLVPERGAAGQRNALLVNRRNALDDGGLHGGRSVAARNEPDRARAWYKEGRPEVCHE